MTSNERQHHCRRDTPEPPGDMGGRNLVPRRDIVASDAWYFVPIVRRAISVGRAPVSLSRWLQCRREFNSECTESAGTNDEWTRRMAVELAQHVRLRRTEGLADWRRMTVANPLNGTIGDAQSADSTSARSTQIQLSEKAQSQSVRETILVTEDEPSVLALVRFVLSRQGYNVLHACKGAEAIRIADAFNGPIDLLVTDVFMPEMNGVQLACHLTAHRHNIKVLFLSGASDEDINLHQIYQSDFTFLQKPFTPTGLLDKVHEILCGST